MKTRLFLLSVILCLPSPTFAQSLPEGDIGALERLFRELPMEARRLTGPLFWLHGDESQERLEMYLEKVAESGNGSFTAESRPHSDWLGEGWYRDLSICLAAAKKHDLQMWIFDEKWWPSQMIAGKVPSQYAPKALAAEALEVEGPKLVEADGFAGERYIAAVAGKLTDDGAVDGESLVDLASGITDGKLIWKAPAGKWKVVKFTHKQAPGLCIDGASQDCVDYFIQTVYQPHYDRFKADFGNTIQGFFYDEPETKGDWGTELNKVLAEWKVDWKKAYMAYKFRLAGDDDVAARFQYMDAFAEAWGRTLYGSLSRWCRRHGVKSIGHFLEHDYLYTNPDCCAGDMMRLQKYSDMGGIDLVCRQMFPGQRPRGIYQTPKLGSSITHVFHKPNDVTMCEIFGGYGQDLTYSQMKWLTDQMQVRGVNFMIPHSFNPRAPYDTDCPPFFYNGGYEPRYPLYRVYADYNSRLSLLLTGGRHVCPVAVLFSGNLCRLGKAGTPEDITSSLQDALFDCDWLPMAVFEGESCELDGKEVILHEERYKVLLLPPTEVIPYNTLSRIREFFDKGGIIVACGKLPTQSATIGKTAAEIAAIRAAVWGEDARCGTQVCKANSAGGRAYLLPEKPTPEEVAAALVGDAGLHPTLEVLQGQTDNWLHVLHRVKAGRDVFLICNQNHQGRPRHFRFRITALGVPEVWDPMRNEITAVTFERKGDAVELELTLEPNESVLLVFQEQARSLPHRLTAAAKALREPIAVVRQPVSDRSKTPSAPTVAAPAMTSSPAISDPFIGLLELPADVNLNSARVYLEMEALPDAAACVRVNGQFVGGCIGGPSRVNVAAQLKPGRNTVEILPQAPKEAKLSFYPIFPK